MCRNTNTLPVGPLSMFGMSALALAYRPAPFEPAAPVSTVIPRRRSSRRRSWRLSWPIWSGDAEVEPIPAK